MKLAVAMFPGPKTFKRWIPGFRSHVQLHKTKSTNGNRRRSRLYKGNLKCPSTVMETSFISIRGLRVAVEGCVR